MRLRRGRERKRYAIPCPQDNQSHRRHTVEEVVGVGTICLYHLRTHGFTGMAKGRYCINSKSTWMTRSPCVRALLAQRRCVTPVAFVGQNRIASATRRVTLHRYRRLEPSGMNVDGFNALLGIHSDWLTALVKDSADTVLCIDDCL